MMALEYLINFFQVMASVSAGFIAFYFAVIIWVVGKIKKNSPKKDINFYDWTIKTSGWGMAISVLILFWTLSNIVSLVGGTLSFTGDDANTMLTFLFIGFIPSWIVFYRYIVVVLPAEIDKLKNGE